MATHLRLDHMISERLSHSSDNDCISNSLDSDEGEIRDDNSEQRNHIYQ